MQQRRAILIALDSVGIDPLGHDRAESVYSESRFLFPPGARAPVLELPGAPVEGVLVETDVTSGRREGAIECALTYTSIFSGVDALERHGLMQGLGLQDEVLDALVEESNLFVRFDSPCLANAIFPAHLPFLRASYVEDLVPAIPRERVDGVLRWRGEPVRLLGSDKRGFAELFTVAEINQNVFVHAARRAGVSLRTWDDVRARRALTGSLTNGLENEFELEPFGQAPLPAFTAAEGAAVLLELSRAHDFVFYKFQLADLVSHTGRVDLAREVFRTIEDFVEGVVAGIDPATTALIVTSDHGHLEQVAYTQGHPKSMVPTWCFGEGARAWGPQTATPTGIFTALVGQPT